MKRTFRHWSAVIAAAFLGLAELAVSADVFPEDPAKAAEANSKIEGQKAHGLLSGWFVSPASLPSSGAKTEPETSPVPKDSSVRLATWTNGVATNGGPMQPMAADSPLPCDHCDDCDCCDDPMWIHRTGAFFDLLYLRPGNIDYIYAVEQTGTLPTDSPTGQVGRVGHDGQPGFRIGATLALSDCSSIQASYTWFQADTSNTINATPGTVLIFQPGVPSIPNVGASSIQASAEYDIRFQQFDIDYRGLLWGDCDCAVNYFGGLRYANLEQRFRASEDVGVPVGLTNVRTDINFDGFGIGFGIDGMQRSACTGLLVYGRASASFVAGEFKADYRQTTQFGPNSIVGNTMVDYRVLSILQSEIGVGWQSYCGRLRVLSGYQFAGWFNALTTGTYIKGVQTRDFDQMWETISFDGFTSRVEWRF
jgi:hypothetical protein